MRVLPVALITTDLDSLIRRAMEQSQLTHAHPVSQLCCAAYCAWAHFLLQGETDDAWGRACSELTTRATGELAPWWTRILNELDAPPEGTGYVVDCLRSAVAANQETDYERVVRTAIALGHDTDTTACVAGGIAGIRFGYQGIPERWRDALRGREIVDPLARQLVSMSGFASKSRLMEE